jgi:hypothetical protein
MEYRAVRPVGEQVTQAGHKSTQFWQLALPVHGRLVFINLDGDKDLGVSNILRDIETDHSGHRAARCGQVRECPAGLFYLAGANFSRYPVNDHAGRSLSLADTRQGLCLMPLVNTAHACWLNPRRLPPGFVESRTAQVVPACATSTHWPPVSLWLDLRHGLVNSGFCGVVMVSPSLAC